MNKDITEARVILLIEQSLIMKILTNTKYNVKIFENIFSAREYLSIMRTKKKTAIFINTNNHKLMLFNPSKNESNDQDK